MATRKKQTSKQKQSRKSKAADIHLPDGYRVIGRAPNWDAEKNPVIEGPRSEVREVTMDVGTKKERQIRTMIVTDAELGPVTVWESGMLKDLFDQTEPDDVVRIQFQGFGVAKKGQNAPRLFSCAVKE